MKLIVSQSEFLKAIQTVLPAVAVRSPLPITCNILLTAKDDRITLRTTDLEIAIQTKVECKVDKEGAISLPAKLLSEFVAAVEGDIAIVLKKASAHIQAGSYKATIRGMDAEDFPTMPALDSESKSSVNSGTLKSMIERSAFAAAPDDTRPILCAVQTILDPLSMGAVDSFRMAIHGDPVGGLLIPARVLLKISKILPDEGEVTIGASNNKAMVGFEYGDTIIMSRLIDGNFPNLTQLIPDKFATTVKVNRALLLPAIDVAGQFGRENSEMIHFHVTESGLKVSGHAAEVGSGEVEFTAEVEGEPVTVAYKAKYMKDAVRAVNDSTVILSITGPDSATVVRGGEESFLAVVMPIQSSQSQQKAA